MLTQQNALLQHIQSLARPLGKVSDLQPLFEQIDDKKYVLLGEASHGTREYYIWRKEISKKLIQEQGFSFIAVEGDWPDCYRVNRYIKGYPHSGNSAREVLHAFNRWPTWMWANQEMVEFVEWLKDFNADLPKEKKVGFYGLDVYSLWDSLEAILSFLKYKDPQSVEAAIKAYRCFEPYRGDPQEYAQSLLLVPDSCEDQVVELLETIRQKQDEYEGSQEDVFNAEQNALVALHAEQYYRTMILGGSSSWNLRDNHMVETLNRLMKFYGKNAKSITWAHNTHVGDARYTDMARIGEYNIGQLVRQQHGDSNSYLVGFGSYEGSVIASAAWGDPMTDMIVPQAKPNSWEELLHNVSPKDKLLLFGDNKVAPELYKPFGHRAIGVVYNPGHEYGNYVPTVLPHRYDGFLYFDKTHAISPLHIKQLPDEDFPETYPWAV